MVGGGGAREASAAPLGAFLALNYFRKVADMGPNGQSTPHILGGENPHHPPPLRRGRIYVPGGRGVILASWGGSAPPQA